MTVTLPPHRPARPARTPLVLGGLLALALSALAACGSGTGEAAEIEVQDAGSGDTVAFRIDVAVGDVERQELQLTQTVDAAGQSVEVPTITFVLVSEVTEVSEEEIVVEQTYEDASVAEGENSSQIESAIAPLVGASGTVTIAPTGGVLESSFDVPEGLDPTAAQTFEQLEDQASALGVTFPEEEIGEGATWTADSSVEANGITIDQTATYTLDSLEGEEYSISVEVSQEIQSGEVEGVEIDGGSGTTTGTFEGTVGTISAATASSSGMTRIEAQGQSVTTSLESEITTTYE